MNLEIFRIFFMIYRVNSFWGMLSWERLMRFTIRVKLLITSIWKGVDPPAEVERRWDSRPLLLINSSSGEHSPALFLKCKSSHAELGSASIQRQKTQIPNQVRNDLIFYICHASLPAGLHPMLFIGAGRRMLASRSMISFSWILAFARMTFPFGCELQVGRVLWRSSRRDTPKARSAPSESPLDL